MDIKFFIPDDQTIPTQLRLLVDGVHVYYEKMRNGFYYRFEIYTNDEDKAREIVEECARIMSDQSYDHGASWRTVKVELYDVNKFKDVPLSFVLKEEGILKGAPQSVTKVDSQLMKKIVEEYETK